MSEIRNVFVHKIDNESMSWQWRNFGDRISKLKMTLVWSVSA